MITLGEEMYNRIYNCTPTIDECGKSILMTLREYTESSGCNLMTEDGKRILSCNISQATRYYRNGETVDDAIAAFVGVCKRVKCDMFNYTAHKESDGTVLVRAEFHRFLNGGVGNVNV